MLTTDEHDRAADAALAAAGAALAELDRRCCDPGRSPRLAAVASSLAEIGSRVATGDAATPAVDEAVAMIEELRIDCCAPDRLGLYDEIVAELGAVRLGIGRRSRPTTTV